MVRPVQVGRKEERSMIDREARIEKMQREKQERIATISDFNEDWSRL